MTKKLCTSARCNTIVEHNNDGSSPRCAKHQLSTAPRKRYEHHYDDQGRNIYKTARWKRTRKAKLILNPVCEMCDHHGMSRRATVVDHIIEIKDGGDTFDFDNLQSLCDMHHNKKTGKEKKKRNTKESEYPSLSNFK